MKKRNRSYLKDDKPLNFTEIRNLISLKYIFYSVTFFLNLFNPFLYMLFYILGYSSISIENGHNGHVFIGNNRYEVCMDSIPFIASSALCGWYGYASDGYAKYEPSL